MCAFFQLTCVLHKKSGSPKRNHLKGDRQSQRAKKKGGMSIPLLAEHTLKSAQSSHTKVCECERGGITEAASNCTEAVCNQADHLTRISQMSLVNNGGSGSQEKTPPLLEIPAFPLKMGQPFLNCVHIELCVRLWIFPRWERVRHAKRKLLPRLVAIQRVLS